MSAVTDAVVRLTAVGKRWDASSGLEPVDLTLHAGTVVAVTGRSGSGKSTLLAIVAGWVEPDRGTVERIGGWTAGGRWRRWSGTAVVPQMLGLTEELSVAENVEVVLRLAGCGRSERRGRVAALLDLLDLGALANRLPAETSLGEQQRLAIARAIIGRPTLLLADEPTCHQDSARATTVIEMLRRAADAGSSVLVATHDPHVAASVDSVLDLDV